MEELQNVTVTVPIRRLPEFYAMLGRLLADDDPEKPASAEMDLVRFADADIETVVRWWALLSAPARRVFEFLALSPGVMTDGSEIAAACQIGSPNGVAGTLSWPGRHATKLGLQFPLHWHSDVGKYSMDSDVSHLIELAKQAAE